MLIIAYNEICGMESFNKNDKQTHFNQVRGVLSEINDGDRFCNITLDVGHENIRQVNLVMKKTQFDSMLSAYKIGDKISVRYYIVSRKKFGRWYTMGNVLEIFKD